MSTADHNLRHVVEKLPAGCHSTKGVGRTEPDPATVKEIDGAKVHINSTFSCYEHCTCEILILIKCLILLRKRLYFTPKILFKHLLVLNVLFCLFSPGK